MFRDEVAKCSSTDARETRIVDRKLHGSIAKLVVNTVALKTSYRRPPNHVKSVEKRRKANWMTLFRAALSTRTDLASEKRSFAGGARRSVGHRRHPHGRIVTYLNIVRIANALVCRPSRLSPLAGV